ncbi:hypothetical protein DE146DRAFT_631615 [Phaeosphaeria sp. MPI-PUGE-AT-0046c]|nr:hypothetical protein DE146DRAFT_631615 [Phaeosphaeria sp. MPI-PUGE-AT-0046c]
MGTESHENEFDAPLLRSEKSSWDDSEHKPRKWKCRGVLVHTVVATLYFLAISALVWVFRPRGSCPPRDLNLYSPASEALQYNERIMAMDPETFASGNVYVGDPRSERCVGQAASKYGSGCIASIIGPIFLAMHSMSDVGTSPSLAPSTFEFLDRKTSDAITADGAHVANCANWDTLDEWATKRRIDLTTLDRKSLMEE